jgi:hypothetical protein
VVLVLAGLESLADDRVTVTDPIERGQFRVELTGESLDSARDRDVEAVHARSEPVE